MNKTKLSEKLVSFKISTKKISYFEMKILQHENMIYASFWKQEKFGNICVRVVVHGKKMCILANNFLPGFFVVNEIKTRFKANIILRKYGFILFMETVKYYEIFSLPSFNCVLYFARALINRRYDIHTTTIYSSSGMMDHKNFKNFTSLLIESKFFSNL